MGHAGKRLLMVTSQTRGGGAEQAAAAWVRGLEEAGHSISVVLSSRGTTVDVAELPVVLARGDSHPLVFALRLTQCIRRHRPDAVISLMTFPNLLALFAARLARSDLPVIVCEQNIPDVMLRREGVSERIQRLLARLAYRRAAAVIAISHAVATNLLTGYSIDPGRCWVIPNAALPDGWQPSSPPRTGATGAGPRAEDDAMEIDAPDIDAL